MRDSLYCLCAFLICLACLAYNIATSAPLWITGSCVIAMIIVALEYVNLLRK